MDISAITSLYTITEKTKDYRNGQIILKYSKYKYGSIKEICFFATKLITEIRKYYSKKNSQQVVIVTPPYSKIIPAVTPLSEKIASDLGIPYVKMHSKTHGDRFKQYAGIDSVLQRINERSFTDIYIKNTLDLKEKEVILIDDMITTGTTIKHLSTILFNQFGVRSIVAFSIIKLIGDKPSLEETINCFILDNQIDMLVSIINNKETRINRHSLKSILSLNRFGFCTLLEKLNKKAIIKLQRATQSYYGTDAKYRNIDTLNNYAT